MGVVNVTPDSFSDGGRFLEPEKAIAHGLELVAQGADLLDIGGESTRPGATPVSEAEELRRVLPVIRNLATQVKVPISVDTQKPAVAAAALEAGASIVNDIAANREAPEVWRVIAQSGAGYVCMHMQGTPQNMQVNPVYQDVVADTMGFFRDRLGHLREAGVGAEQVILDVGIGFGKNLEHNLQLLASLGSFTKLGRPLLVGVSRKSFLGTLLNQEVNCRLPGSLAGAVLAVASGAQMIRAHDVAETVAAVRTAEAILARRQPECTKSSN